MKCPTLSELPPPPPGLTGWPWTEETPAISKSFVDGAALPKISVITPSYNQGEFIEKTIRSVLLQGYPHLEYIVMDGGSKDNSVEIIRKYSPWLAYWVSEKDGGQCNAINRGWDIATGEVLHWLNSDDTLLPGAISAVAQEFAKAPDVQVVSGVCSMTNIDGVEFDAKPPIDFDLEYLLKGGKCPGQPTVFMRSSLVQKVGKLNEQLNNSLDWEYWVRISQVEPKVKAVKLSQSLAVWCQWEGCKSVALNGDNYNDRLQTFDKLFANPELPKRIKKLRGAAYGHILAKQALIFAAKKERQKAMQCILRSIAFSPSLHTTKQFLKVIVSMK